MALDDFADGLFVLLRRNWSTRPCEANVEADKLTKGDFEAFEPSRRINVVWEDFQFPMIDLLM